MSPERLNNVPLYGWACFHCGEIFSSVKQALAHFGDDERATPACQIAARDGGLVERIREQDRELERYRAEDSDTDRAMHGMRADHARALILAEEAGYNKGVHDRDRDWREALDLSAEFCLSDLQQAKLQPE